MPQDDTVKFPPKSEAHHRVLIEDERVRVSILEYPGFTHPESGKWKNHYGVELRWKQGEPAGGFAQMVNGTYCAIAKDTNEAWGEMYDQLPKGDEE